MKFDFTVGEIEQHRMELSFDQTSGDLTILMDGTQVLADSPKLTTEPVKCYELNIGEGEQHKLAFMLSRTDDSDEPGLLGVPRLMVTAIL